MRRAFSITEILVVVGILVILVSVLLPMANSAYKKAAATRLAADLQAIAQALDAYKGDFQDYPRLPLTASRNPSVANPTQKPRGLPDRGSVLLAWALLGPYPATQATAGLPEDGADGFGFRIRRLPGPDGVLGNADDVLQGRQYGPYLQIDRFKTRTAYDYSVSPSSNTAGYVEILDSYGNPILYFPARPGGRADLTDDSTNPTDVETIHPGLPKSAKPVAQVKKSKYVGPDDPTSPNDSAFYNSFDNGSYVSGLLSMLPRPADANPASLDAQRRALMQFRLTEAGSYTGPFLLWSAGANSNYFDSDDVTNFEAK